MTASTNVSLQLLSMYLIQVREIFFSLTKSVYVTKLHVFYLLKQVFKIYSHSARILPCYSSQKKSKTGGFRLKETDSAKVTQNVLGH